MQTVIVISEEFHGFIGIAKDYKNAIHFLIDNGWIKAKSDIFYNETNQSIDCIFGKHWQDEILALDFDDFCEFFDGWIYLCEETVFEKPLDKRHKV